MKRILVFIIFLGSVSLFAQDYDLGIYLGPNLSFLSVKSVYKNNKSDQYNPWFGFEAGGFGSLRLSEKISFDHSLAFQFLMHKDQNVMYLRYPDGSNFYNVYEHKVNNAYIVLSSQLAYHFNKKFYLSAGMNINFMLYSLSFFKEAERHAYIEDPKSTYKNTYYGSVNAGIPIVLGYHVNKVFMRFKFDVGVMNLMKDSNSFFKEKEHNLSLCFGYFLR